MTSPLNTRRSSSSSPRCFKMDEQTKGGLYFAATVTILLGIGAIMVYNEEKKRNPAPLTAPDEVGGFIRKEVPAAVEDDE